MWCLLAGRYWSGWTHCLQWTWLKSCFTDTSEDAGRWNCPGQCQVLWWWSDQSSKSGTDCWSWHSYGCKRGTSHALFLTVLVVSSAVLDLSGGWHYWMFLNTYIGPLYSWTKMYGGHVACCPLVSHGEYAGTDGSTPVRLHYAFRYTQPALKPCYCAYRVGQKSDTSRTM